MSILSVLSNITGDKKTPAALSREEIVELLKTSPKNLKMQGINLTENLSQYIQEVDLSRFF